MNFTWTNEDAASQPPGRGVGEAPAPKKPPTERALLKKASVDCLKSRGSWENHKGDPDVAQRLNDLLGWFEAIDTKRPLDAAEQGLAYQMFTMQLGSKPSRTPKITRYWMRAGGPQFMVRALLEAYSWQYATPIPKGSKKIGKLDPRDGTNYVALLDLRAALAGVSEADYQQAVAVGRELWSEAGLGFRTAMCFLFPTEADWAADTARGYLAGDDKVPREAQLLGGSLTDPDLIAKLALRLKFGEDVLLQRSVPVCGDAMVELSVGLYASAQQGGPFGYQPGASWQALATLARFESEAAAKLLTERLVAADKYEAKYIEPFFLAWPALALPHLKAAEGDAAAAMLAKVLRAHPELDANAAPAPDTSALPPCLLVERPAVMLRFVDPLTLPQLLLADGTILPPAAADGFLQLLQQVDGKRTAEVEAALVALDPTSVAAFGLGLFDAWANAGRKASAPKWIPRQLAFTLDDDAARAVVREVKTWSGSFYNPGTNCIKALAAYGSDAALLQIHLLSQKSRSKGIKKQALAALRTVAAARGLSAAQLEDRLVPDMGLPTEGLVLDFGPRQFQVRFDEGLVPFVLDAKGKARKNPPKANAKDDATQAAEATATWRALKKDVKAVASTQIARLEQAMVSQHRWAKADFERYLLTHPLMVHLVRRLLWGDYDGDKLLSTFRVDGAAALAGPSDETYTLAGATVGIVHPHELSDTDKKAWAERLGDYEILQPFEQLTRPVFTPTEAAAVVAAVNGAKVPHGHIRGLISKGWSRGAVVDNGYFHGISLRKGAAEASVHFEAGVNIGGAYGDPVVELSKVQLKGPGSAAFSEICRDHATLAPG